MDHSKKQTYLFSIDALRVISILAVILIHITTKSLATLNLDIASSPVSFFLNQASRFAVPLFFLISGFVLELNNKTGLSYGQYFKKRASRIIVPFIFWSTVYFLRAPEYGASKIVSLYFLTVVVQGFASYHLYFIPTLILFYLAFPLLHTILSILKNPFVLISIVAVQTILLYNDYYIKPITAPDYLRVALLSFSMFILGMVASHFKDEILLFVKRFFPAIFIFLILILATVYFHVSHLMLKTGKSNYMYSQYHPLNYLYTLVLSSFLFYVLEKTQFLRKQFIALSKLSFFVFFIHVLIQYVLWDTVVTKLIEIYGIQILRNVWFDPLMFAVIAFISFSLAYLVHKISWAPKITG